MWFDTILWLAAIIAFIAVEAATTALVSVWFAVGAAAAGAVANLVGFSEGLSEASARSAGLWVFVAVLPLAVAGVWAAFGLTSARTDGVRPA